MKICFFSGDITRSGGTERVACMIANGLARQGKFEVCILSLVEQADGKQPFFPLDPCITHEALGERWIQPGPGYVPLIPKLRRFLKQRAIVFVVDIDIVLDVLSVPAVCGRKTKVISWEHFSFGYETSVKYGYRNLILRHVTTKTDAVITLTERDRQAFLQGLVPADKKVFRIHNPIGDTLRHTAEKKRWMITVGRLAPEKGMDYLLHVADLVLKKYPEWQWLLLGDGEQREWVEAQVRRRHLEQRLLLKGHVADVDAYLAQAQIFVLTSRREGLPMCLLEAKAHRLACVSFDIETGPDEIIEDGSSGFLIPPYDCEKMADRIGQLIEDEKLRRMFMQNAEIGMEKFCMGTVLKQWNEVLKSLC